MEQNLNIYIDRLRDGHTETFSCQVMPESIELQSDDELSFLEPISIEAAVNIASKELVLCASISTRVTLSCTICGKSLEKNLKLGNLYHVVPLEEVQQAVYNYGHWIRETILLEAPRYGECEGSCPERPLFEKYFSDNGESSGQTPFSTL